MTGRLSPLAVCIIVMLVTAPLSGCSTKPSVPEGIQDLSDGDATTRCEAAAALGESRDARAVEPLIAALKDEDVAVRSAAASALGMIGDPRAVEPLRAACDFEENTPYGVSEYPEFWSPEDVERLKEVVITSIVRIGEPAVEPLIAHLAKKKDGTYEVASESLVRIGAPAVEPLIAALRRDPWSGYAVVLRDIGGPATGPLLRALETRDLAVVAGAHFVFIEMGESGSEDVLVDALNSRHGSLEIAEAYLASGNPALEEAAKSWAERNGYQLVYQYTSQPRSGGWGGEK